MMKMRWLAKVVIAAHVVAATSGGCWKNKTDSGPDPDPEFARVPQRPENSESSHALGEELSTFPDISIQRVETEIIDGFEVGTRFGGLPERKWELEGELMAILEFVYPLENRILQETAFPNGRYRIIGKVPDNLLPNEDKIDMIWVDWKPPFETVQQAYATTFGIRIAEEVRFIDVYMLTAPNGRPESFVPSTPDKDGRFGYSWGTDFRDGVFGYRFSSLSMGELAWWLESELGVYVADESDLTGHYDFFLAIEPSPSQLPTVKQAIVALEEVGLSFQPAQREVRFLVIAPGEDSTAAP